MQLDAWNTNGFSIQKDPNAAEGSDAIVLRGDGSQNWFGVGYTVGSKMKLDGYRYLTVALKTRSQASFKIGASHSYGSWVYFVPGNDPYGFKRDGQWHTLHIPMSDFLQPEFDWANVDYPFALVAAGLKGPTEIAIDHIYFDQKSTDPNDYLLIPKGNEYQFEEDDRQGNADELNGEMKSQVWNFQGFEHTKKSVDCHLGRECQRLVADGKGYWFGFAYAGTSLTKILEYKALEFAARTRSQGKLKVGMIDSKGKEYWIKLQESNFNLPRDGQWHVIRVPLSEFQGVDLLSLKTVFAIVGEEAVPYDIDLDGVKLMK